MKLLIADDERHVREAIKLLGDWERHGVTQIIEAADGDEASLLIEEHRPQIILTDMRMPRMDGKRLLQYVSEHASQSKVVVISGYDDFELVRHAIRHGSIDYILKPIDPDALNESIGKAISAWKEDENNRLLSARRNIEINQMKPHYANKLLSNLLQEEAVKPQLLQQLKDELGLYEHISTCTAVVLHTRHFHRDLMDKFQSLRQLLFFTLINISNELLESGKRGMAFHNLLDGDEVVLLIWDDTLPIDQLLEKIQNGVRSTLHYGLHFGVGQPQQFPKDVHRSYKEARRALWERNLMQPEQWIHHYTVQPPQASKAPRLVDYEEKLKLAALSGNQEQMSAVIQQWVGELRQMTCVKPDQLLKWDEEWEYMLAKWRNESNEIAEYEQLSSATLPLPLDKRGLLSMQLVEEEWMTRLQAVSALLTKQHTSEAHIIYDIAKYLESNYHQELSLQDMANRFYLSREYISRKFRQEFGVTFSDYLGGIRIERAKLLLLNPNLRISQVAEMVGYQDEKYFSKVFKKQEGRTPNEYRKEEQAKISK